MKKILFLSLLLSGCGDSGSSQPEDPIWIVAGQSNSIISEPFTGIEVRAITSSGETVYRTGNFPGVATRFALHLGDPLIAPVGVSGTALSCWQVGGVCFAGMSHLYGRRVAGVLWWQGEADAQDCTGELSARYQAQLSRMINDWRVWFGQNMPFIVIEIENGRYDPVANCDQEPEYWETVRSAQHAVAKADNHVYLIQTTDITYGDTNHPTYAYDEIARRARDLVVHVGL